MKLNHSLNSTTLAAVVAFGLTFTTGCGVSSDPEEPDQEVPDNTDDTEPSDAEGDPQAQDHEGDDTTPCDSTNCDVPDEDDLPLEGTPCELGIEARLILAPECSECACGEDGLLHCTEVEDCLPTECSGEDCCQASAKPAVVCETGWTCSGNQWACDDSSDCPAPQEDPELVCAAVITQVRNPQTGICCTYSDSCGAPEGWKPCDGASNR